MKLAICLCLLSLLNVSSAGNIGVGIGFGSSSRPYDQALRDLKSRNFDQLKTWSIDPEWLEAAQSVYSEVKDF